MAIDDRLDLRVGSHPGGREQAPGRDDLELLLAAFLHPLDREVHDAEVMGVVAGLEQGNAALVPGDGLVIVTAEDEMDAAHLACQGDVRGKVEMGQRDDNLGAHLFQLLDRGGGGLFNRGEGNFGAGRGQYPGLRGE